MLDRQFGPLVTDKGIKFRLWAPAAKTVNLMLESPPIPMLREAGGWYFVEVPYAAAGTRYKFRIDGGIEFPDPASAFQPQGSLLASAK